MKPALLVDSNASTVVFAGSINRSDKHSFIEIDHKILKYTDLSRAAVSSPLKDLQ